ncbi:pH-response regulator protein palF/RIM8 [Podosphaera aphanis]|nr:pH-response regulator protein palF/RIM8 [Podosphaera aphanis]
MSPDVSRKSSASWSTTSKTILTRFSALSELRPRFRYLVDFHIRPDEPHRKYSPGDTVKGAVILTIVKPFRITHLTVCLHGFARVFKSPNGANEHYVDPGLATAQGMRKSQYFGNGHASLFQDEITLSGEGRLEAGIYEFNFELMFPPKSLPTSIDFERGTISYLITSTLTRPTPINATKTCECKVSLVETVDVGCILPPKPQIISLTPVSRGMKRKRYNQKLRETQISGRIKTTPESPHLGETDSILPDDSTSVCSSVDDKSGHKSTDEGSENQSIASANNSSRNKDYSCLEESSRTHLPCLVSLIAESQLCRRSMKDQKKVTATIELLKSGCLPGDNLQLKITIKHTKPIRSMNGVIITLYRQGKIDSAPPISQFTNVKGKEAARLKHEEYYPKSKTGLRGLSLTSAGSSSIFRKDLAQTFAPIVVDPTTLTAVINTSIRVPEHVFPTICSVPGQMITFKYSVEVVVDLGGKLAGQQRHSPLLLRAVTLPLSSKHINSSGSQSDTNINMPITWGKNIIGTESIRREKSVVACSFEVIVGSKDSVRSSNRGLKRSNSSVARLIGDTSDTFKELTATRPNLIASPCFSEFSCILEQESEPRQLNGNQSHTAGGQLKPNSEYFPLNQHRQDRLRSSHTSLPIHQSELQLEKELNTNERAWLAEVRFLSRNSPNNTASSISRAFPHSSLIEEIEEDINCPPRGSMCPSIISSFASVPKIEPSEDKQELEYRRLLAEVSAPSFPAEDNERILQCNANLPEPTAPMIVDDDSYGARVASNYLSTSSISSRTQESLPRYER